MELICTACNGTGIASDGNPCNVCGGDGVIDLIDDNFPQLIQQRRINGIVWNEMLIQLADLTDKVNDVINKCDDIKEVVDAL